MRKTKFLAFGLTVIATWGCLYGLSTLYASSQPIDTHIQSVAVVDAVPGTQERSLVVEAEAPPAQNCQRLTQLLLMDNSTTPGTYYPLGSAINGGGFSASGGAYRLMLSLPSGIPAGVYHYLQRSVYTCSWLHGFLNHRMIFETPPVPVTIGLALKSLPALEAP